MPLLETIARKLSLSGRPSDQPIGTLTRDSSGTSTWTPTPKDSTDYKPLAVLSKEERKDEERFERKRMMMIGAVPDNMGGSANHIIRGPAWESAASKHGAVEVVGEGEGEDVVGQKRDGGGGGEGGKAL